MRLSLAHKHVLINTFLVTLSAGVITAVVYWVGTEILVKHALENMAQQAKREEVQIGWHVRTLSGDVLFLSNTPPVPGIFRARASGGFDDPGGSSERQWRDRLATIFSTMLAARESYLQIRLLDERGGELVRVERTPSGEARRVDGSDLQNKAGSEYFKAALSLERGEVYLSPINLNREYGEISLPHTPVIRSATRIVDAAGVTQGIIVINMDFGRELRRMETLFEGQDRGLRIANHEGSFLIHPEPSKRFSFDLGHRHRIQEEYPLLADLFLPGNMEHVRTVIPAQADGDVVVAAKLYFDARNTSRFLAIVLSTPYGRIAQAESTVLANIGWTVALLIGLFLLIGYGFSRYTSRPLVRITESIGSFARGDSEQALPLTRKDEIGSLARAFDDMAKTVRAAQNDLRKANQYLEQAVEERTHELRRNVRALSHFHGIITDRELSFVAKLDQIMQLGNRVFDTEWAVVSHIEGARYTVTHSLGGESVPAPGTQFDLKDTYCSQVLRGMSATAYNEAGRSALASHTCYRTVGVETYIGAPILLNGVCDGTLAFSRMAAREHVFNENELSLVQLFAQWIGLEMETLAAQSELNRFKSTLDRTLDCVFMFEPDSLRFFYANLGAMEQVGRDREELMSMRAPDINCEYDEQGFRKLIEPLLKGEKQVLNFETMHRNKRGEEIPVEEFLQYIAPPGESPRFVSIVRDISERRRVDRMINEFVSTVSHELRTPLTSIRGSLGLLEGGALGSLSDNAAEMIKIASANSRRLLLLINDILDIQKIESGMMNLHFARVPVAELLRQAIHENQSYADQFGVRFVPDESDEELSVLGDHARLMQVLNNLMSNAAKFSPSGSVVELGVERRGERVRISVSDRGPGVPEEFRAKLFDKFTQLDSSDTRSKGGTGLGLHITRLIVEKHGSEMVYTVREQGGSIFRFELPVYMETEHGSERP